MLDWMHCNKVTDESAKDMWTRLRHIMFPLISLGSFYRAKALVKQCYDKYAQRIDICVQDCVAFYDCKHAPGLQTHQHSRRTKCPVCDRARYVTDPKTGKQCSRKFVFYFPLRADLVPHLYHNSSAPAGQNKLL